MALPFGSPTPASADESYEPKVIPKCSIYKVGGQEICGFTFEEWKEVLRADAELVHVRNLLEKEKTRTELLREQIDAFKKQIEEYAKSQALLLERNEKLTADLISLDKKYQDERVKPRLGSPVAWTITAVAVAVLGGYVVNDKL